MEFLGFVLLFLICMGIAKAVNSLRRTLTINGAAIYLMLAALFVAFNIFMASRSDLEPYQLGYTFGRSVTPAILVGLVALYYFFKFKSDKAHERHVKSLREKMARDDA